jgi:HSP20 family protein
MALVRFTRRPSRMAFPAFGAPGTLPVIEDLENRIGRFIDRALTEPVGVDLFPTESIGFAPAMEIVENPTEFTLSAELPGLEKKDVEIALEDGMLTISGEKTEEKKEEKDKKVYLYERTYGSFQRSFTLPPEVDASKIAAEFEKGVLKVHLPKGAKAKTNGRKIEIKAE